MRSRHMAIRKLLLPLTGTAAGEAALSTCLMIARIWNAHVTALHVRVDSRDVAPLAGEGLSGAMIEEMMSATEKESAERAEAVRVLSADEYQRRGPAAPELAAYLACHDIHPELAGFRPVDRDVGAACW